MSAKEEFLKRLEELFITFLCKKTNKKALPASDKRGEKRLEESQEECEYLINLAKPHMVKSTVVDSDTGKSTDSRVRTSSGTFLARGRDKTIRTIEKRIADFTFLPVEHGEGLQILHYEVGQKYEPHYDYFQDEFNTKNGGQRMATVLMYLSDVEEGGETVFPSAKGNISAVPWWNELSECGKEGLSVKPKMGDALLFWSMRPDASLDPSSLHGQYINPSMLIIKTKQHTRIKEAVKVLIKGKVYWIRVKEIDSWSLTFKFSDNFLSSDHDSEGNDNERNNDLHENEVDLEEGEINHYNNQDIGRDHKWTLELSQNSGPNFKVNGHRLKHYFGGCPGFLKSLVLFVLRSQELHNPQLHLGIPIS
ncbi:probable prolyl 4-hydroxylase 10 [Tanacetum coccineum]